MKRACASALLAIALAACGLGPYRTEAIARVRESCNDRAVSTRDVTEAREAERHAVCERTHSTQDCTPIASDAHWIRTDACRHAQRWLCTPAPAGTAHCEPDPDPVIDETP